MTDAALLFPRAHRERCANACDVKSGEHSGRSFVVSCEWLMFDKPSVPSIKPFEDTCIETNFKVG